MSATGATGQAGATGPAGTSTSKASDKASDTPKKEESGMSFDSLEEFWKSLIGTPTTNEDGELTGTGIVMVSMIFLGVLSLMVLFSTGSVLSLLVFWLLVAVVIMVLIHYKYIDVDKLFGKDLIKRTVAALPAMPAAPGNFEQSEVFHVFDNNFTYDDAPVVCAAYGAKLATLEQIIDAYNKGAEWCGYGWSAGGMALYPTQKSTWDELQREIDPAKRTRCGRPGVNGGYFDPMNRFGVNCYGFKPEGNVKFPVPAPGVDHTEFQKAVDELKPGLKSFTVSPWSRMQWNYGTQFTQTLGKLKEGFTEYLDEFSEATQWGSAANAAAVGAPYGLRGGIGPLGPTGPAGPAGPASTVPGPMGPTGPQGLVGSVGSMGPTGPASTVPGPTGPPGLTGPRGFGEHPVVTRQKAIAGLVGNGTIKNFYKCLYNSQVQEIAKSMPVPEEESWSDMQRTKRIMCSPYYSDQETNIVNDNRDTRRTPVYGVGLLGGNDVIYQ
jgi:hypothetical protein